jgi:hypothetical protein
LAGRRLIVEQTKEIHVRKHVLAFTLLVTFSASAQAQIAFDAAASGEVVNGTSLSYNHAVTGTSALLVVGVYAQTANDVVNSPTYNGTPLTLIDKVFFAGMVSRWVYQYALGNAPQGTHALSVTTNSAVDFAVVSASYRGVDGLPADNSTKQWDPVDENVSTTTTLTPNTNNTWTILVGGTAGGQPIGAGSGSTLRVSSGDTLTGWPSADRLGIFDSNGPISPAAPTSMTITGSNPYTEFGTVMASYAPAETTTGPLPLLYSHNLTYLGGFRVPFACGSDDTGFGGASIAFSPTGNLGAGSLYISSYDNNVAEISLAAPLIHETASALNEAYCVQNFVEPTEGVKAQVADAHPSGMAVVGGKLWINNGVYYDGSGQQTLSVLSRPLHLTITGQVKGLYGLTSSWLEFKPSMAAKSIAEISSDWTGAMGGNLFLSKFNWPIISSQSFGPNAIVTSTATLVGPAQSTYPAAATPLFYPGNHTLSPDGSDSGGVQGRVYTTFSQAHDSGSLVQPKGTSSLLVFQVAGATRGTSNGGYGYGYGCGCNSPVTAGSPTCDGMSCPHQNGWFYDPERPFSAGSFATHGYPYVYQVVAYDMNHLAAVNNNQMAPWEPRPYAFWEIGFPISPVTAGGRTALSNATYDSANNKIYIAQLHCCDSYGLDRKPIIHVFQVNP